MIITTEQRLRDFEFWGGAIYVRDQLTREDCDRIEEFLMETDPDGMAEIELNDYFWHEPDEIAQLLGFEDFDELVKYNEE